MNHSSHRRRSGFTLVEILVAVSILAVLLVIILVPVRLAVDTLSIGRSRANLQQSAQTAMQQIETDVRRAIHVFPNAQTRGVTNLPPYTENALTGQTLGYPYFLSKDPNDTDGASKGVCNVNKSANPPATATIPYGDVSRLDLLLPRRDVNNTLSIPVQPGDTIVTYYARRERYRTSATDATVPAYETLENPVMLFRAQFPFRYADTNRTDYRVPTAAPVARNANVESTRYSTGYTAKDGASKTCTGNGPELNRETLWLTHNSLGEANLEPLCTDADTAGGLVLGTHTPVIPNGTGLVTPQASTFPAAKSLVPTTSFACQDTNNDGKIDRVTVNLIMEEYDGGNADVRNGRPNSQVVRLKRIIDLPNVR